MRWLGPRFYRPARSPLGCPVVLADERGELVVAGQEERAAHLAGGAVAEEGPQAFWFRDGVGADLAPAVAGAKSFAGGVVVETAHGDTVPGQDAESLEPVRAQVQDLGRARDVHGIRSTVRASVAS